MDPSVKDAIARWPDVPAVFGWLSLDARGRWRLHPQGQAAQGGPGESITNAQILGFINRNYEHDEAGRWFFQNGPQRVYLRLDAAPYVLRLSDDSRTLVTHTDAAVDTVSGWWLDDGGQLYAMTPLGPGIVLDRDLPALLDRLTTPDGAPLLDVLDALDSGHAIGVTLPDAYPPAPLRLIDQRDLAATLGFQANPIDQAAPGEPERGE
ncbi:hypothetical protein LMG3458_04302 [Achromobacter deleyi]|uniref:DUF2946 domain-containing protein n=1 Tax=Achromobacter deleyi TaxID=1353891 RepID=A0A6S7ADP2_9BURK|nr:DUF2946 family protein [Achromobacter deleyi]CAB3724810.1 hypothetical protein LMG3458_04302 [Achromobacter deleyi]CAB3820823.1 hypothetical protein LMG3482_00252 [Achromobacter deleyi]CAB3821226.1 hypothetical protein LMG3481_00266 [Achromobacter deleyi]